MGISRAYIRKEFDRIISAEAAIDEPIAFEAKIAEDGISSQRAEELLRNNRFWLWSALIHFAFAHRVFLKRIPLIGKLLIRKKESMLKETLNIGGREFVAKTHFSVRKME